MERKEFAGFINESDGLRERIEYINQQIQENNVQLQIKPGEDGMCSLWVVYKKRKKNERGAGKKRIHVKGDLLWTVQDVRALIDEQGAHAAATTLGVSTATMYRRLKELKEGDFLD